MMITRILFTAAMLAASATGIRAQERAAVDYVDPFIGTRSMGHVFPGACVPHGIVQLSPDTEMVPHNIDGLMSPIPTAIVPGTSTTIRRLSVFRTRTSVARATPTWATSC